MIFNYIRVSTISQNTDRQLVGVSCDREFLEKISAKDMNRPQLTIMLSALRKGDIVNLHDLSRLARNTKDLLNIVEQIISVRASIKFHKENMIFNGGEKQDPFQKLMLSVLAAISEFERNILLQRQREGISAAKLKGRYKGKQSRYSKTDIEKMKEQFNTPNINRAKLAREIGITRQHMYKLCS